MLQLAPAARSKDRAKRIGAKRRLRKRPQESRYRVLRLYGRDRDPRTLAGQRSKAKNDLAAYPAYGLTVGQQIAERNVDFVATAKRRACVRRYFSDRREL
jgi:hypothetical protein